jgi:hypothetical protein
VVVFPSGSLHFASTNLTLLSNRVEYDGNKRCVHVITDGIKAEVALKPVFPLSFEKPLGTKAEHNWLCKPVCRAWGKMMVGSDRITFDGLGQENHLYGSGPPTATARRWMRGQILFPRAAVNFLSADNNAMVMVSDESGVRQSDASAMSANWNRHSLWSLPYPSSIDFGRWLILRNPRIVVGTPGNLELLYDAYADGQQTTAWIELDYPDCLRGRLQAWAMERKFVRAG